MKKVLALMLVMVLVLTLAACGGGGSNSGNRNEGKKDEVSSEVETTISELDAKHIYHELQS